jgi:hypothetical protein
MFFQNQSSESLDAALCPIVFTHPRPVADAEECPLPGDPNLISTAHSSSDACNIFSRNGIGHEDRYSYRHSADARDSLRRPICLGYISAHEKNNTHDKRHRSE